MTRTDPGLFVVFEGIDGAGKTTQAALLHAFLRDAGERVVQSKEPTDGPWGRRIRASAQAGRMSPADELHALTQDRTEHVRDLIVPHLDGGGTVVLDRYFYSTIAYQSGRGMDPAVVADQMDALFPLPDVVFVIDVPAAVGVGRIEQGRGERPNQFEQPADLSRAREVFRTIAAARPEVVLIDGTPPAAAVHREVVRHLIDGPLKDRHCAKSYGCDEPLLCSYRKSGTCRWATLARHAGAILQSDPALQPAARA